VQRVPPSPTKFTAVHTSECGEIQSAKSLPLRQSSTHCLLSVLSRILVRARDMLLRQLNSHQQVRGFALSLDAESLSLRQINPHSDSPAQSDASLKVRRVFLFANKIHSTLAVGRRSFAGVRRAFLSANKIHFRQDVSRVSSHIVRRASLPANKIHSVCPRSSEGKSECEELSSPPTKYTYCFSVVIKNHLGAKSFPLRQQNTLCLLLWFPLLLKCEELPSPPTKYTTFIPE
jgi:hypothetical protein